jgi:hypothetical protein
VKHKKSVFLDSNTKSENSQALRAFLGTKTKIKGYKGVATELKTSKTQRKTKEN